MKSAEKNSVLNVIVVTIVEIIIARKIIKMENGNKSKIQIINIFLFLISIMLATNLVSASTVLLSDQGTDVKNNGVVLTTGNITIFIYDSSTGGNTIYNQTFVNNITNGSWNIMINPNLEFGRSYWKDYSINGQDLDFDGVERLEFNSPLGLINNVSFINFSLINSCSVGSSIRVINENGSVVCETDDAGSGVNLWMNDSSVTYIDSLFPQNVNFTGNLSLGQKITFTLGEIIDNIIDGWIRIAGNLNVTGNVNIANNLTVDSGTLFIDSNNDRVGIGTSSPGEKLYVNGSINVTSGNDVCIEGGNCLSSVSAGSGMWTNSSGNATFITGNVGIGTSSPVDKLHITDAAGNNLFLPIRIDNSDGTDSGGSGVGIGFKVATGGDVDTNYKAAIAFERLDSYGRGTLHFLQDNTNDPSNADLSDSVMSITADGFIEFNGGKITTDKYLNTPGNTFLGYQVAGGGGLSDAGGGDNGLKNTAVGWQSLYKITTGYRNTAVGWQTLYDNTVGYENTAIGRAALNNNLGSRNTGIGKSALFFLTTGDNNTALGYNSGISILTGSNNIVIGHLADVASDGDNQLSIGNIIYGNLSSGNIGIGTSNPDELTHIAKSVDGVLVGLLIENSQANTGGSTNETAEIRFGFGGDNDVARIVARKQNDYSGGTASMNSQLVFHVDVEGSDDEIVYLKKDGLHFTSSNAAKILFENTPGGMAGMGIFYEDSGSAVRSGLTFPGSDVIRLANRASNGVVEIGANTVTGGSGGEVIVAIFEDDEITFLTSGGNVGIGTDTPQNTLNVIGDVNITGNLYVSGQQMNVPDYVFELDYKLMPLSELQEYIGENSHLPNSRFTFDTENLIERQYFLLEKIEEAYLYILELKVENDALKKLICLNHPNEGVC